MAYHNHRTCSGDHPCAEGTVARIGAGPGTDGDAEGLAAAAAAGASFWADHQDAAVLDPAEDLQACCRRADPFRRADPAVEGFAQPADGFYSSCRLGVVATITGAAQ